MTGQEKGDLLKKSDFLIEVTTWACSTVYKNGVLVYISPFI